MLLADYVNLCPMSGRNRMGKIQSELQLSMRGTHRHQQIHVLLFSIIFILIFYSHNLLLVSIIQLLLCSIVVFCHCLFCSFQAIISYSLCVLEQCYQNDY